MPPNGEPPTIEQRLYALTSAIEAEAAERERESADFHARIKAEAAEREKASAVWHARLEAEAAEREKSSAVWDARMDALTRRHEALTMSLELMSHESETARKQREEDSQNIRALARIADMHDRRLSKLEDE